MHTIKPTHTHTVLKKIRERNYIYLKSYLILVPT